MPKATTPPRTLKRGRPSIYHFDTIELGKRRRYPAEMLADAMRIQSALRNWARPHERRFETSWNQSKGTLTVLRVA